MFCSEPKYLQYVTAHISKENELGGYMSIPPVWEPDCTGWFPELGIMTLTTKLILEACT